MTRFEIIIIEVVIGVLVFLAILLSAHAAIECRAVQGEGAHWSWRSVDGKKCWYQGAPGLDKSKLVWPASLPPSRVLPARKLDELKPLNEVYDEDAVLRAKPMEQWSVWDRKTFERLLLRHGERRLRELEQQEEIYRLLREQRQ